MVAPAEAALAVTDEPIRLDINSSSFSRFITKIKGLTYYDPATLQPVTAVVTEETTPVESTTEAPVETTTVQ